MSEPKTIKRRAYPLLLTAVRTGTAEPVALAELMQYMSAAPLLPGDEPLARTVQFNGYRHVARIISSENGVWTGSFSNVKETDLPNARNVDDQTRSLRLRPNEGLDFLSHFIVDPSGHEALVLYERGYQAPAWTTFQSYLGRILKGLFIPTIELLLTRDAWDDLRKASGIRGVKLRSRRPDTELLASLFGFDDVARTMTVEAKWKKNDPLVIDEDVLNHLKSRAADPDTLALEYYDLQNQAVDLLGRRDHLWLEVPIEAKQRTPTEAEVVKCLKSLHARERGRLRLLLRKATITLD